MKKLNLLNQEESGFTLIELMVVMATMGILAGLMASIFSLYRTQAHNSSAQADLRNSLTSLQAYLDDNDAYPTCVTTDCNAALDGFSSSKGVFIAFAQSTGTAGAAVACHTNSGDKAYLKSSVIDAIIEIPIGSCGPP